MQTGQGVGNLPCDWAIYNYWLGPVKSTAYDERQFITADASYAGLTWRERRGGGGRDRAPDLEGWRTVVANQMQARLSLYVLLLWRILA